MCDTVYPSAQIVFLANVHPVNLVWDSWFLLHYHYWTPAETPWLSSCCPVLQKSCRFDSGALAPSCALVVHQWGRCWGGLTHRPGSGFSRRVIQPHSSPMLTPLGPALQHCPGEVRGQLSQGWQPVSSEASSPALMPRAWDQFSHDAQAFEPFPFLLCPVHSPRT